MNTNHDALREALELLRIFKNNLGPDRASLSAEDAILWDRVEALSQPMPMPEAAAQEWKLVPLDALELAVRFAVPAMEMDRDSPSNSGWMVEAADKNIRKVKSMLSASPAAPAQPQAQGEPGNNEGKSDGRNDEQRPALGANLSLGVGAGTSVACSSYSSLPSLTDVLWGSSDVMALNAELGLTMDQLVRIANVVLQSHREAITQHLKGTQ